MAGVAAGLVFLAAFCLVLWLGSLAAVRRGSRVTRLLGETPVMEDEKRPGWLERVEREAMQAGLAVTAGQLVLIALAGGAVGFAAAYAVTGRADVSLAGTAAALYAPRWWVARSVRARARLFEAQLEDFVGRLVPMLRAGVGLVQAMRAAVEDMSDPARREFTVLLNQAQVMPLTEAFERACLRVRSPELEMISTAIAVTQEQGGNLAVVLERVAEGIRSKRNFRERVEALTAESRLSANVMIGIVFGMLVMLKLMAPMLVNPIFNTSTGLALFGLSAAMMFVGWHILARQAQISLE